MSSETVAITDLPDEFRDPIREILAALKVGGFRNASVASKPHKIRALSAATKRNPTLLPPVLAAWCLLKAELMTSAQDYLSTANFRSLDTDNAEEVISWCLDHGEALVGRDGVAATVDEARLMLCCVALMFGIEPEEDRAIGEAPNDTDVTVQSSDAFIEEHRSAWLNALELPSKRSFG